MDEQQPAADDPSCDDVYALAWWQWFRHHFGTTPEAHAAAAALYWAPSGVNRMVLVDDPESAVILGHRLLHEPGTDVGPVAETPLQNLLEHRGAEVEHDVARMCAKGSVWREAVGMVVLADEERAAVPALARHLPP